MKWHGCEAADARTAIPRRAGNSKIISNYWKTFDIDLSPDQVYEYYYESEDRRTQNFIQKLNGLINSFNQLFGNHSLDLQKEDKKKFSYLLARKMADFRKRSKISLFNPIVWIIILSRVRFISIPRLINSQIIKWKIIELSS